MSRMSTVARRVGSALVDAVLTAAAADAVCDCGTPLPDGDVYCSTRCRLADKDHGPDEDAPDGAE